MLILEANNIAKSHGDRLIFKLDSLKIYDCDRIGIVGLNGAGKTTLMNILAGETQPDEGYVKLYGSHSYIRQLENPEGHVEGHAAREFGVAGKHSCEMSGGEKTRMKIAVEFDRDSHILFADEPTCNLDIKGIKLLEEKLRSYKGALVLISHDRALLDNLCNSILEIENEKAAVYSGNYTEYRMQKDMEFARQRFEYDRYVKEKNKLENAAVELSCKSKTMRKAPSRMGNSEARLHKRRVNSKKAKLDGSAKAIESRIQQLEVKEKPRDSAKTRIDVQNMDFPVSKTVLSVKDLEKSFGARCLFERVCFDVPNGSKTALVGDNGTGKSTLIKMILNGESGVRLANGAKIGYFSQELDILDNNLSVLENVMKGSIYAESFVRTLLARLLFKEQDVFKKVRSLSGGERVKASFARIFAKDVNLIILDEPTNYLDINSEEALEKVLKEYEGTVLFVSHDRKFIDEVADRIILLENRTAHIYEGNYSQYLEWEAERSRNKGDPEEQQRKMVEELRELSLLPAKNIHGIKFE